jgi:hypothetical protein
MSLYYRPTFRLMSLDPGLRGCGIANYLGGALREAAYVKNPVETGRGYAAHVGMGRELFQWAMENPPDHIVIEHPRVYPSAAQQKGDPNDLLDLVGVGAAFAAHFSCTVETVFPSDWKGQVPKDIMVDRIRRALSPEELATIAPCAAGLRHNIYDACGIGLWKLSRINRKVVHHGD